MGTVRRRGKAWHAEVRRRKPAFYASSSWPTKGQAQAWIGRVEGELAAGRLGMAQRRRPFRDVLDRYAREVSPGKAGSRWEALRLAMIARDPIADVLLTDLGAADFAAWRDRRLAAVKPGSVLREMNLLRHAVRVAVREWRWMPEDPMAGVRRPKSPRPRDRLATCEEIERILFALGYDPDATMRTASSRVAGAWLFAAETGMRAGEIAGLTADRVDADRRVARLERTKNGHPRDVALSPGALYILRQLPPGSALFGLATRQIDALWRKGRARAGVKDLTFHDSRHLAITRLARVLGTLELARMVGHRDVRQLQVYYNAPAEETAAKL